MNRRKAVQEETSLIAIRVFEKLLARKSRSELDDDGSQLERASAEAPVDSNWLHEEREKLVALTQLFSRSRASEDSFAKI